MGKKKKRGGKKGTGGVADVVPEPNENEPELPKQKWEEGKGEEKKDNFTVDDLMARVDEYLENFNHEMAEMFCQKALKMEPNNLKVLESYGNVCAEIGDIEKAKHYFQQAVRIQPDEGHVKYLYLGQLSEGLEAVQYYEKGVSIMLDVVEREENNVTEETQRTLTKSDICSVYCSLAEIFMTDCCMEENAEIQCEKYCKLAVEADDKSLDAAVAMGNLLLNQCQLENAKVAVESAHELWSTLSKETQEELIPEIMSYEARVTLIKLLIEVECYGKVSVIVDQLIEENEDDVRIWYYLGFTKSLLNDSDNPRFYLEKALELFEKTGYENEEMLEHINQLLSECPPEENMDTIAEDEEEEDDDDEHENSMDVN